MADTQTFANHRKFVPLFHYVMAPILAVNLFVNLYGIYKAPGLASVWSSLVAFAILLAAFHGRLFALGAQDRVIRLEEQLRMKALLPADLQGRIADLRRDQVIALRFASDAELPELTARVLRDNIQKRDEIKKLVTNWRADHHQL